MCALRLRIEQDLRESRRRGHESRVGEKTSKPWFGRGSIEFVRVFVRRSHPLSFWLQLHMGSLQRPHK